VHPKISFVGDWLAKKFDMLIDFAHKKLCTLASRAKLLFLRKLLLFLLETPFSWGFLLASIDVGCHALQIIIKLMKAIFMSIPT